MVKIGSSRIDENGKLSGGVAGDQTGLEVAIEPWYLHSKGWVIIRAKDDAVRERIAQCMEAACANDNIGYNQDGGWDVYDLSKPYGWDCSKISKPCSSDCSNLVRTCIAYAVQKAVQWFSTLNEVVVLSALDIFEIITDAKYTKTDAYLKRGDILCTCTQGHTVVVLDDGSKVECEIISTGNTTLCGTGIGTAVAKQAMHVRDGASTSATSYTVILAGVAVEVLALTASGWYKIVWPGASCGYAYTKAGEAYYSYTGKISGFAVGDAVSFVGGKQYISANAATPVPAQPCKAQVTRIYESGKHKYHVIGDNVYGWVDETDLRKG